MLVYVMTVAFLRLATAGDPSVYIAELAAGWKNITWTLLPALTASSQAAPSLTVSQRSSSA